VRRNDEDLETGKQNVKLIEIGIERTRETNKDKNKKRSLKKDLGQKLQN